MMIPVYDKDAFPGASSLFTLEEFSSCSRIQEWNRRYEIEFTYPVHDSEGYGAQLEEYQLIDVEGQWFRIHQVERLGGGNYHTSRNYSISVLARHVFYDLAKDSIDDEIYDESEPELPELEDVPMVTCQEALEYVLQRLDLVGTFTVSSNIAGEKPLPNVSRDNGVDAILEIVDLWDGVLVRDNWDISVLAPTSPAPSATVEYRDNMQSIQETQHSDELVAKIYPVGANNLRLPERYRSISVPGIPSLPFARHVTFNNARTEETLRQYADDYLDRYGQRMSYYRVDCVLLQEEAKAQGLATPEDILYVDVGDAVIVRHSEFNIDVERRVISVQRDLLHKYNTRMELGKYLHGLPEYLDDVQETTERELRELYQQKSVMAWAEEVMKYVYEILGGTLRDFIPEFLLHVGGTGYGQARTKTLLSASQMLAQMGPGVPLVPDTQKIHLRDPLVEIGRRNLNTLRGAYSTIQSYISWAVGGSSLVTSINSAYAGHFGTGQVVGLPAPTVETAFGSVWPLGSEEYRYARRVLQTLQFRVGNISEVYLELGGGNGGAIGALCRLWELLHASQHILVDAWGQESPIQLRHSTFISTEPPDPAKGKEGDLWFQIHEEEPPGGGE